MTVKIFQIIVENLCVVGRWIKNFWFGCFWVGHNTKKGYDKIGRTSEKCKRCGGYWTYEGWW